MIDLMHGWINVTLSLNFLFLFEDIYFFFLLFQKSLPFFSSFLILFFVFLFVLFFKA